MFSLKSSNTSTKSIEIKLNRDEKLKEKFRNLSTFELISTMIFSKYDLQNQFYSISAALCMSDEWKIPISKKYADILYFSLCANSDPKSRISITNLSQAASLFDESDNDYRSIEEFEENTSMRFESYEPKIPFLFPGTRVEFKIPVRFFRNKKTGKSNRTIGLQKFFKIVVNEEEIQIPMHMLLPFFENSLNKKGTSISIIVEQSEKIGSKFEMKPNSFYELLVYIGYVNNKQINQQFKLPKAVLFLDEGKLVCKSSSNDIEEINNSLWVSNGNNKIFLPRMLYILFQNKDSYIVMTK